MEEEIFQDPYDDEFIPLLLKTPKTLTHRDCSKFFKLVIPHLSNEKLPVDIGQPILMVLSVLIRNEKIRDIFISSGFLYQLPFKNKSYTNEIFMIFNEIVKNSPEAFDDELTNIFASILTRSPQKALSILCSYAQQFNEIDSDNPWPMIDILIQGSKYFVVPPKSEGSNNSLKSLSRIERLFTAWQSAYTLSGIAEVLILSSNI